MKSARREVDNEVDSGEVRNTVTSEHVISIVDVCWMNERLLRSNVEDIPFRTTEIGGHCIAQTANS